MQADLAALLVVAESILVMAPGGTWGEVKTGAGTPPIRIAEGWLSVYHGVDAVEHEDRLRMIYSAGMVVHDAREPHRVLYRSEAPIMAPQTPDECVGVVGNVVFPTGIDRRSERTFDIYYGMADAKIGRALLELTPVEASVG